MKHLNLQKTALILLLLLFVTTGRTQVMTTTDIELEEIVIAFEVPKAVVSDLFVQYDGSTVYLPLVKVFTLLDINIKADMKTGYFSGFYINKDNKFEFDLAKYKITVAGKEFPFLASNFYLGENDLYIKLDAFNNMFDLNMQFDFNLLRVFVRLNKDFPVYQKLLRKVAREKLKKEEESLRDVVDLSYKRQYLSAGTLDWVLSANPYGGRNKHYYNLKFGGMLLGGDLKLSGGGSTDSYFDTDQFDYQWHYSFNKNDYITQAEIGDVSGGGALSRNLDGFMVTNRPQVRRKFFQTINISDFVGANWEVEMYVDNKLTDYMYTGQDGFYNFSTDTYYGASNIELKMYGPNGEYRTSEKIVRVPFNLIPKGIFEYSSAFGESFTSLYDSSSEALLRAKKYYIQSSAYYGITNGITFGVSSEMPLTAAKVMDSTGNWENLENMFGMGKVADPKKPLIGFDATYQMISNMTMNTSFIPGYLAKAQINYSLPAVINLNTTFSKFSDNKTRNQQNRLYSLNFAVSSPLKIGSKYLGLRYNITLDKFADFSATNMNYGFNFSVNPIYLTYIGQYKNNFNSFAESSTKSISTQLLISTRFSRIIQPQFRIDYDHSENELTKYGVYIAKRIFKTGQLTLSYERNHQSRTNSVMLTFNFMRSFADLTSRVVRNDHNVTYNQMQRGSIRYDTKHKSLHFDRRNAVGFGSAVVKPFLDDNYNGVMDNDEEYLSGLRAKIKGARVNISRDNKEYFYNNLRPYEEYTVQIDQFSLDDPMLKPTHENYKVKINPNVVTSIQVPIVASSEISGKVERQLGEIKSGIGGFKVYLMNLSKESLIELPTFNSGDFYYLGLIPGSYRAYIDREQLDTYGYKSVPESFEFEIKPVAGGTFLDNINFVLVPKEPVVDDSNK